MAERSYPQTTGTGDGTVGGYGADRVAEVFKYMVNVDPTTGYVAEVSGLNTLAVASGSGLVTVASGVASVNGYTYVNDASLNVSVPTPAASTRIDRIVLRWGSAAATVRAVRLAGTEGGGAPSLTQNSTTYEVSLAQISTTTGGTITVTDQRAFLKSSALRGATDASTIEWDTTNKYLKVKSGGITGTQLNQTSISYPGQLTLTKTGGASTSALYISAASPAIGLNVTSAGTNEKKWDVIPTATTLSIRAVNDAENSAGNGIVLTRSGSTITSVALAGTAISLTGATAITGTFSTSGAATLASASVTGAATVGSTLGVTGATTLTTLSVSSTAAVTGAATVGSLTTAGQVTSTATGGATSSGFYVNAASPSVGWRASGGGSDSKLWDMPANNTTLSIRAVNDAANTVTSPVIITRSGMTITSIALAATALSFTGATAVTGALTVTGTITGNLTGDVTGTASNASAIADGAVSTAAKLASNVVTTAKILDANVTTAKIADANVTTAKMAANSVDDTIAGNRVSTLTKRMGGNATNWNTVGTSTYVPTGVRILPGVASITFSGGVTGTGTVTFPTSYFSAVPHVQVSILDKKIGSVFNSSQVVSLDTASVTSSGFTINGAASSSATGAIDIAWTATGPA